MACNDDVGTHSFCVRTKTFTGFRGCGFFWLSKPVHNASECDGSNAFQQIKFDTPFFWSDKTLAGESCSSSPRPARIMYDETRTKDGHAQAGESTGTFDFAPKNPHMFALRIGESNFFLSLILYAERTPFTAQEVKPTTLYIQTIHENKDIPSSPEKKSRCSIGTKDQCAGQYQASCPTDASGRKKCIGVCH